MKTTDTTSCQANGSIRPNVAGRGSARFRHALVCAAFLLTPACGFNAAHAATIVVNSTNDPAGFNSNITVAQLGATVTFRDAVNAANNTGGNQTITFNPSLAGATITLGFAGNTIVNNSALGITASLAITGPAGGVTLSISNATISMRHFYIASSGALALTGLTLTGGLLSSDGGSIYNLGKLATTNVTFTDNQANNPAPNSGIQGRGAAIFNTSPGTYTASLTTFSVNTAQGTGGAIYNDNATASAVVIADSAFLNDYSIGYVQGSNNSNDRSGGGGGAIYNNGSLSITRTVLGGCTGNNSGGAIYNDTAGVLAVTNCLFDENYLTGVQQYRGAGIYSAGSLVVTACTFDQNTAGGFGGRGGGIGTIGVTNTTLIINSTFTGNYATYGCAVAANSGTMVMDFCTCTGDAPDGNGYQNIFTLAQEYGTAFNVTNSVIWDTSMYNNTYGSINYQSCLVYRYANGLPNPTTDSLDFLDGGPGLPLDSDFSAGSIAITAGSAAINAGIPIPGIITDERGVPRDAWPDIGAYEYQAPQFVSASGTTFAVGLPNTFLFSPGGTAPVVINVSGALPAGVSFNTNGVLSGVPAAGTIGTYPLTVTASNNFTPGSTQNFTLSVVDGSGLAASPGFETSGLDWALNGDTINGGPTIINNVFTPTDGTGGETRSAWFEYPLYIGGFEASFTYQDVGGNGADGTAFVIQNSAAGTSAIGGGGGELGYVGISPSIAVMLDIYSGAPGGPSGVLVATNGAGDGAGYSPTTYESTAPVNLDSSDPIAVNLLYVGGVMQISFTDTVTSASFQTNVPINIPAYVGTNAAWVGFTGSEGGVLSHQTVSNFSYEPLPMLTAASGGTNAITLSWPASVYGFQLQASTNLNGANWNNLPVTIVETNELNEVQITNSAPEQFFRLAL